MNVTQEYKQTEFGPIPSDWILCTFQDVLTTFSSGATPYRGIPEYYKGNVRWISSGELNYNKILDTVEHISQQAVRNANLRVHQPGTFLMAITGLEAEGTRGRCAFIGAPATTNQSCLAINGTERMCTEYLFWFYRMWGQYLAFKYCQGTKQQSYTASIVRNLPIYGPKDIAEQQAIAEALSDIDGLIAALDRKIAKKRLIKQGAMQQLLTGKKRLPGFADLWVEKKLGEIVYITTGRKDVNEGSSYGAYPFFTCSTLIMRSNSYSFDKEAILIAGNGDVGNLHYYNGKFEAYQRTYVLYDFIENVQYLYLYLQAFLIHALNDGKVGSTIPYIVLTQLTDFVVKLPQDKAEQTAIATILTDMDKEIADLETKRDM